MSKTGIRNVLVVVVALVVLVALFFLLRPGSSPGSRETGATQEEPIALAINGNTMSPDEVDVTEGQQVNLQISSDRPVEFHLHGYDLTEEVEPEEPAELSFEAANTGRFAIEDHNADAEIGALLVVPR